MRGAGHANREALHASRERSLVVGLDNEVQVVRLHREMHHAKARLFAQANRSLDGFAEQLIAAKARQAFAGAHRHVDRMPGLVPFASAMGNTHSTAGGFPPRALSSAAVAGGPGKRELLWLTSSPLHLNRAYLPGASDIEPAAQRKAAEPMEMTGYGQANNARPQPLDNAARRSE